MPTPKLSNACRQSQPVLTKEKHPPIPMKHLLENPVFAMASQQFDLAPTSSISLKSFANAPNGPNG